MNGRSDEINLYGEFLKLKICSISALTLKLEVLEIERGASKTEIKKAYHKVLTLQYALSSHFPRLPD